MPILEIRGNTSIDYLDNNPPFLIEDGGVEGAADTINEELVYLDSDHITAIYYPKFAFLKDIDGVTDKSAYYYFSVVVGGIHHYFNYTIPVPPEGEEDTADYEEDEKQRARCFHYYKICFDAFKTKCET